MTNLAFYEFFRNTVKNTLISLFLAAMCLMITVMYSVISYEYGKFAPFKELDVKNGYFVGQKMATENFSPNDFDGVEKVYEVNAASVSLEGSGAEAYVYDGWIWKNWHARLKSGHWFNEAGADSAELEIIVGGNCEGYAAGDTVQIQSGNASFNAKIIGILQDSTEIMYKSGYNYFESNYQGMYNDPYGETGLYGEEGGMTVLMQKEAAEKRNITTYSPLPWSIWKYSDSLSSEEADALSKEISLKLYNSGKTYDVFMEESQDLANQKVMVYLPSMIISILLMLASLYCIAYVNVQKGSRFYSIYYLTGANKRQCNILALSYTVITVALSVLMYIMLGLCFEAYARSHNLMYSFVAGPKLMAAGLYVVFAVFLSICLYLAMRKRSPLDMLRSQKR